MGKIDSDIPNMLYDLRKSNTTGANELVSKALKIIESQINLIKNLRLN